MVLVLLFATVKTFSVSRVRNFSLLPYKVKADAINDLQYCGAKMATKSDVFKKYGHTFFLREIQENLHNK